MAISRRKTLALLAAPLFTPLVRGAIAQDSSGLDSAVPKSFKHVFLKEDSNSVFYFFDFSCPVSGEYHMPMLTWAKTAPTQIQTKFIPIINPHDSQEKIIRSVKAAKGYYTGVATAKSPEQLEKFITQVYSLRQDRGIALDSDRLWVAAINNSGMSLKAFASNTKSIDDELLQYAMERFVAYGITASPSAAVAGQYSFNPDNTNGDPEMFFNILSGLATQLILS